MFRRLLTTRDVLEMATIEGARANGLLHKTGTLTPGKQADMILLRTDMINVMPVNDPVGAIVLGMDVKQCRYGHHCRREWSSVTGS